MTYSAIDNGFYKYDFDAEECADSLGNGEFQITLISGNISGTHNGATLANKFGAGDNDSGTNTKHYRTILKFKTPTNPSAPAATRICAAQKIQIFELDRFGVIVTVQLLSRIVGLLTLPVRFLTAFVEYPFVPITDWIICPDDPKLEAPLPSTLPSG